MKWTLAERRRKTSRSQSCKELSSWPKTGMGRSLQYESNTKNDTPRPRGGRKRYRLGAYGPLNADNDKFVTRWMVSHDWKLKIQRGDFACVTDPRNHVPKLQTEVQALWNALQTTRDHFREIMGFEPESSWGENYISEYCNIQQQLGSYLGDGTALRRLNGVGTVFDGETSQVEQDPGIGRKRPL